MHSRGGHALRSTAKQAKRSWGVVPPFWVLGHVFSVAGWRCCPALRFSVACTWTLDYAAPGGKRKQIERRVVLALQGVLVTVVIPHLARLGDALHDILVVVRHEYAAGESVERLAC